ncbi:amidase [Nocardioides limicola]|uniref:amidase n=1 Tax=Nocardioides limicola TaxID=2803368 RepID=UPI00193B2D73|nr:amidase [Nocardioides sp. DJM-14]
MTRVHAYSDDALGDSDAVDLNRRLASGHVSIPEVVDAAITRTERVAADLGAVAMETFQAARDLAAEPSPGWFAGIPTFIKDNVAVAGLPTQQGCDAFVSKPAKADGDFVRMYRATGLVPLGKTQLSEFGFSASAEHPRLGPVRNPWHIEYSAGASSSGSAALVAAGAVPIAHANDGGGSIRIPAAVNGLVGLKPTRGRLPQDALLRQMPVRIVADGVVTRSVRDTAAFFREAEKVYRNVKLPPIGDITRSTKARLKVAVVTRSVDTECDPEVRDETLRVAALMEELGHQVEEVDPPVPSYFPDDFLLYWGFLAMVTVRTGRRTHGRSWDRDKCDNLTLGLDQHVRRQLHKLPLATTRLAASRHVSARFFRNYDVVLTPTLAGATPRLGHLDPTQDFDTLMEKLMAWVAFTPLQNATGDPAISLPLAQSADGMPLGMMFAAAQGREATLLELAYELEEASPPVRISQV